MLDITRITDICVKYEITYDEYMLLYTRFIRDYSNMAKYFAARASLGKDAHTTEALEELERKGYIEFFGKYKGTTPVYDLKNVFVTPKFSETLWIETWESGEQLFKVYPDYLSHPIKGQGALAKSVNADEYIQKYSIKIWSDVELHNRILGAVIHAEKIGEVKEGIAKFIDGMPYSYQRLFKLQEENKGTFGDLI